MMSGIETAQSVRGGHMKKTLIHGIVAASMGATALGIATPTQAAPIATTSCAMPGNGYGKMFPSLASSSWSTNAINALSVAVLAPEETNPTPEGEVDSEDNKEIAAGYTYFGQFVDHDLTLDDRANDLVTPTPVASLVNGRTPQLDLDSVYGNGPTVSSSLYEADGVHMKVGTLLTGSNDAGTRDLPRGANGQAIIGDPRNDENRLVAGIHSLFLRFHNATVDRIALAEPTLTSSQLFTKARAQVVAAYQSIIINDFLPQIVGQRQVDDVVQKTATGWRTNLRFYNSCQQMPVEFAVAAYRFGHSMVRGLYRINDTTNRVPVFSGTNVSGSDLTGFSPSPKTFGINFDFFLPSVSAMSKVQPSYKIDNSITYSLGLLPLPATGAGPANLAKRNVLRSQQVGLPSGQAVARAMRITPLRDDQILVGKSSGDAADTQAITSVSSEFAGNAPLWTYILAEATAHAYPVANGKITGAQRDAYRLGPVGGRIVAETIVGLMKSDPSSILNSSTPAPRYSFRSLVNAVMNTAVITPAPKPVPSNPSPVKPAPKKKKAPRTRVTSAARARQASVLARSVAQNR
jgi:hypothetical protein